MGNVKAEQSRALYIQIKHLLGLVDSEETCFSRGEIPPSLGKESFFWWHLCRRREGTRNQVVGWFQLRCDEEPTLRKWL